MEIKLELALRVVVLLMILSQMSGVDSLVFGKENQLAVFYGDEQGQSSCSGTCDVHTVAYRSMCCEFDSKAMIQKVRAVTQQDDKPTSDDLFKCLGQLTQRIMTLNSKFPKFCCRLLLFSIVKSLCNSLEDVE